jgi:hypothetical protein
MIIDHTDDRAQTLIEHYGDDIPEHILDVEMSKTAGIRKENFAVFLTEGGEVEGRLPIGTRAETEVSSLYLQEHGDSWPSGMQKAAAASIVDRMAWFGLEVSEELSKLAEATNSEAKEKRLFDTPRVKGEFEKAEARQRKDWSDAIKKHFDGNVAPIRNAHETKVAMLQFGHELESLEPSSRRENAVKLSQACQVFDIPTIPEVEKYAGVELSSKFEQRLYERLRWLPEEVQESLAELSKLSEVATPEVTMKALEEFDLGNGLDTLWDHDVVDPALTVFEKTAEDEDLNRFKRDVVWEGHNLVVSSKDIEDLATETEALLKLFDADHVLRFQKNPVTVFKSLPDEVQSTLAHMTRRQKD